MADDNPVVAEIISHSQRAEPHFPISACMPLQPVRPCYIVLGPWTLDFGSWTLDLGPTLTTARCRAKRLQLRGGMRERGL